MSSFLEFIDIGFMEVIKEGNPMLLDSSTKLLSKESWDEK